MTATLMHPVAPEEVMAFVDGELAAVEAAAVEAHVAECDECAELVREFRGLSVAMAEWAVPPLPPEVENAVPGQGTTAKGRKPARRDRAGVSGWKVWALGGAGAVAALVAVAMGSVFLREEHTRAYLPSQAMDRAAEAGGARDGVPMPSPMASTAQTVGLTASVFGSEAGGGQRQQPWAPSGPMIARTVSLTLLVKDVGAARPALDAVLARHHGYAARLTVNTPDGGAPSVQASLRVPAAELQAALSDLRALGRVENETQSGEEVTQQHADLVQRLTTARETEAQLRDILAHRTGKLEDVLQVEEETARVRGQIEGMEAEQQALEHRVAFASVDLYLSEVYQAPLGAPDGSFTTHVWNSFVAGYHHAAAAVTGLILFALEYGPVLLVWAVILGVPGFLVWRRYRKVRTQI